MERINPPKIETQMVKQGEHIVLKGMSEFGFFSTLFCRNNRADRTKQEIMVNETIGTLIRTKGAHENEGGVTAGFAVIDNPVVVPALKPDGESKIEFLPLYNF